MPANLTPQYHKAESAFRQAQTPEEELQWLQVMLREIPKHKGTDKMQADLKAKISKLKTEVQKKSSAPSTGKPTKIPLQGAGRVLLIGAPNSGKSSLLAALTRATPEIAPYPFTTQSPQPGMMLFEDVPIQLLDLPPITADYCDVGTIGLVRGAVIVFLVIDLASDTVVEDTQAVLDRFRDSKTRLGIDSQLDEEDIGVSYTATLVVYNKCDLPDAQDRLTILKEFVQLPFPELQVSATTGLGLDELRKWTFDKLDVVRVYTKHPKQKEPDMSKPFTIKRGETLVEVAEQVHHEMAASLKGARVWGRTLHAGTPVKPDYQPEDKDIVELHAAGS
jgi:ribosome-interacting GTPase 1